MQSLANAVLRRWVPLLIKALGIFRALVATLIVLPALTLMWKPCPLRVSAVEPELRLEGEIQQHEILER